MRADVVSHSEAGPRTLARILREEVDAGRGKYHSTSRRYVLNGEIPDDVKRALLDLALVDDRR